VVALAVKIGRNMDPASEKSNCEKLWERKSGKLMRSGKISLRYTYYGLQTSFATACAAGY
jgi:hypothetical protein